MIKSELNRCLLIRRQTRDKLKTIATKNQTYDDLLNELIILKLQKLQQEIYQP